MEKNIEQNIEQNIDQNIDQNIKQNILIEKSQNDNREYFYNVLPNELEYVIIYDKASKICGSCLNVHVGSINEKVDGLAHFLEHMVFMGSSKYPDSNDFMKNINENGGITNASTSDTNTMYYFTINPTSFLDSLDRFSQFFISPLLKKEMVQQEMNAVDSESKKSLKDDGWIQMDIFKQLLKKNHPLNHYTCGDLSSLDIPNIHTEVKTFHKEKYQARYMKLVIYANDQIDLNKLVEQITNTFGIIPNHLDLNINRKYGALLEDHSIINYVPHKDDDILSVVFEFKNPSKLLDKPFYFITYLMGSEVPLSLYELLLSEGLIINCTCSELVNLEESYLIAFECILTEKGLLNVEKVYSYVIAYMEFIKESILESDPDIIALYDELNQINKLQFIYYEKEDVQDSMMEIISSLTENIDRRYLLSYDTKCVPFTEALKNFAYIFEKYSIGIIVGSKSNKKCDLTLPRYNVCYSKHIFTPVKIDLDKLTLPVLNKYISFNSEVIKTDHMMMPIKLDSDQCNMYYIGNTSFNVPTVEIRLQIWIPNILNDPVTFVYMLLYLNTVYSDKNKEIMMVKNAHYVFSFKVNYDRLYITLCGYRDKIDLLVSLLDTVLNGSFKSVSYKTTLYQFKKRLRNFNKDNLLLIGQTYFESNIYEQYYLPDVQLQALKNISQEKMVSCFRKNFKNSRVNMLISGNLSKEDASKLGSAVYSALGDISQREFSSDDNIKRIEKPMKIILKTEDDENNLMSVTYDLFRMRKSYTENWKSKLLFLRLCNKILSNKYFNTLRTKQQLGYIVKTRALMIDNNNYQSGMLQFLIQSPTKSAAYLEEQTMKFISEESEYIMKTMTEDEFMKYIEGEKMILKQEFNNLSEFSLYYMGGIIDESFYFDLRKALLKKICKFSLEKFKSYFDEYIIQNDRIYTMHLNKK